MAKTNGTTLLEQHLEKLVLAASVLILVLAVAFRAASSPRKVDGHSPDKVDEILVSQAQALEARLQAKQPERPDPPEYLAKLKDRIGERYPVPAVEWQPERLALTTAGEEGKTQPTVALAQLVKVINAPEQPIAEIHREVVVPTPDQIPPADRDKASVPKEVIASHVVAVYPHGLLRKQWEELLKKVPTATANFLVAAVQAERRHRLPDGSWSAPVTVAMVTLPSRMPPVVLPKYTPQNRDLIRQAIAELARAQEETLEPGYWNIVWPSLQVGDWKIHHKPRTRVSDLLSGRTAIRPSGTAPGAYPWQRRGAAATADPQGAYGPALRGEYRMPEPTGPTAWPRPAVQQMPRPMGQGEQRYTVPSRRPSATARPSTARPTGAGQGTPRRPPRPPRPPVGATPKTPVRPTIKRPAAGADDSEQPKMALVPSLAEQLSSEEGILELWFHDTALSEGVTYSYRVRLVLLNPLFERFEEVAKRVEAETVTLLTPWSEWSEPVTAKYPTEFYVVGDFPAKQEVYVEVFTLKWGQRIQHRFNVRRGEPIGAEVKKELLAWNGQFQTANVDFHTRAIVVDLDFTKKVRQPKTNTTRDTTEMLYLGAEGKLGTRTVLEDQASERRQELQKEVQQAPTVAAGRP